MWIAIGLWSRIACRRPLASESSISATVCAVMSREVIVRGDDAGIAPDGAERRLVDRSGVLGALADGRRLAGEGLQDEGTDAIPDRRAEGLAAGLPTICSCT